MKKREDRELMLGLPVSAASLDAVADRICGINKSRERDAALHPTELRQST